MSNTVHAFDYLDAPEGHPARPVCVVFGAEPFLRQLAREQIRRNVLKDSEEDLYVTFSGDQAEWRDVADELATFSLFGGGAQRLVVLDGAGDFVTKHRSQLEDYVERPKPTGILVLDVDAWPANTRLYKLVNKTGLQIDCRPPEKLQGRRKVLDETRLSRWLSQRVEEHHNARLEASAARLLLELVGPDFGLLEQGLAKLALFTDPGGKITPEMVRDVVGGWRTKTTWELIDAAVDGDAAEALRQFDRLLQSGEHPLALLGQISWSLRRFAAATRIFEAAERRRQPMSLREALEQSGFRKWPPKAMENAERQLRQLGRDRAGALYQWLLETDLALKGSHSSSQRSRFVMEQLILRMATRTASDRGARVKTRN